MKLKGKNNSAIECGDFVIAAYSGFIGVARVTAASEIHTEINLCEHTGKGQWEAEWKETDLRTKAVTVKRSEMFATKQAALNACQRWQREIVNTARRCKEMNAASDPKRLLTQMPPEGCRKVTTTDLEDADKAAFAAFKQNWPRCAALFQQISTAAQDERGKLRAALPEAYALDAAELTGGIVSMPDNAGRDVILKLADALGKHRTRTGPRAVRDAAINFDLRLNWLPMKFCFEPMGGLAKILNDRHNLKRKSRLTAAAIKMRLRRLGLSTKRNAGPPPTPAN